MQVGDTIWVFDINRRVYPPGRGAAPIWREHWEPRTIQAETSRSWVLRGYPETKVPKYRADPRKFAFSELEVNRQAWLHDNRYQLGSKVERCDDYHILQAVAKLFAEGN